MPPRDTPAWPSADRSAVGAAEPLAAGALCVRGAAVAAAAAALGVLAQSLVGSRVGALWVAVAAAVGGGGVAYALCGRWVRALVAEPFARLAERLRAEQVQRGRAEKLATVGRMAAGIAHEVGNPLAAIGSYAHVARLRAGAQPGVPEALDALEREADRIDRIVRGLLDYGRPRRLTPTAVGVNDVVRGAVRLLGDQGVMRRIETRCELDPRAPAVFAERHELEQVFVNLLLNAADALAGRGRVTVLTRQSTVAELGAAHARRVDDAPYVYRPHRPNRRVSEWLAGTRAAPDGVVQVVVADSGPGVAPGDEERIFDPFFTTKEPGRGTGLGLAIVARTVDSLGGAVWVQRAREGGAAFVLVLPLARGGEGVPVVGEEEPQLALPLSAEG
jgi:hypothetical protein